jgi:hypothetical protein
MEIKGEMTEEMWTIANKFRLLRNCHGTSTETEWRNNGDQGREMMDNRKQVLIPVTGVIHLDSTQVEHGYLYKNV